jgi:excisionase family DNA binding protein
MHTITKVVEYIVLTIKQASEFLGVSISTLRRWESEKKIISERTEGGHRRYDKNVLISLKNKQDNIKLTIGYCRVSSSDQKEDLERQVTTVSNYCSAKGYQFRIIQDLGSGLNYNKKGLKELIELVSEREIDRIVVNYKDRLIRYGYEIIEELCQLNGVKIEVINYTEDRTYEQELVEDVLSIITVFSSKLYGSRSHKVKCIKEQSKEMFRETI